MTPLDDAELRKLAKETSKHCADDGYSDDGQEFNEDLIFQALKQIRDARLKGPSDEEISKARNQLNSAVDSADWAKGFYDGIRWLRSQLRLEPAPRMPTEAEFLKAAHDSTNTASQMECWLRGARWLIEQLGLGDEAK